MKLAAGSSRMARVAANNDGPASIPAGMTDSIECMEHAAFEPRFLIGYAIAHAGESFLGTTSLTIIRASNG